MMRSIFQLLFAATLIVFVTQCGSTQKVSQTDAIQAAWENGNATEAFSLAEAAIAKLEGKVKPIATPLLEVAGAAAVALGNFTDGRKYLEQAMNQAPETESLYPLLVSLYDSIDNLSYQITTLENYKKRFPEGQYAKTLNSATFKAYVESENWELAETAWTLLDSAEQNKAAYLEAYIEVLTHLKKDDETQKQVQTLLRIDPKNTVGLTYQATAVYERAEKRYRTEMAAYDAHKTRKQYAQLLEALKLSTEEFKEARDMFETVYEQTRDKAVAGYLANIYARLNIPDKAAYYKSKAQ